MRREHDEHYGDASKVFIKEHFQFCLRWCVLTCECFVMEVYIHRKKRREKMNIKTPERQTSKKDNIGVETRSL